MLYNDKVDCYNAEYYVSPAIRVVSMDIAHEILSSLDKETTNKKAQWQTQEKAQTPF